MAEALLAALTLTAADSAKLEPALLAMGDFAVAANSGPNLQAINARLMPGLRAHETDMRLMSVKCQILLTEKLREDWLGMLSEMLPLISELQEDDDERIEAATLRWIRLIEDILGESLEPMLQ